MINILFVCLGNICRSPSGEGVFKTLVKRENLETEFFIDSAGTSAFHVGEQADRRMQKHAAKRNIYLTSRSRKFAIDDFAKFDYIMAMDNDNYMDILSMDKQDIFKNKVFMMTDFSPLYQGREVPDPYYGGGPGFEDVLDLLEESCLGLLEIIKKNHEL
ncbi:MAG: low molecular weight phosphotyrosine protein phosphatase [Spirochaetales bacterium]|nr:low molecular weight phosphotyrosine protein phosphatase [Spirochaetales bacterium]